MPISMTESPITPEIMKSIIILRAEAHGMTTPKQRNSAILPKRS